MGTLRQLEERREQILQEIKDIRAMRKGSVIEQYLKVKHKGHEEPVLRGPYFLYTRKEKGKTVGQRLKKDEVHRYQQEVEAFHRFQDLCDEYAGITEQIGDLERERPEIAQEKNRRNRDREGRRSHKIPPKGKAGKKCGPGKLGVGPEESGVGRRGEFTSGILGRIGFGTAR